MLAQAEALTARSNDDAEIIARRFLQQGVFQLDSAEVEALQITRRDRSAHNGVTQITLQQQVNGIEVFGAQMSVHVTSTGEVFATNGELIPNAARAATLAQPRLAATVALERAADSVGLKLTATQASSATTGAAQQTFARTAELARAANVRLVYFPLAADKLQLAWELEAWRNDSRLRAQAEEKKAEAEGALKRDEFLNQLLTMPTSSNPQMIGRNKKKPASSSTFVVHASVR